MHLFHEHKLEKIRVTSSEEMGNNDSMNDYIAELEWWKTVQLIEIETKENQKILTKPTEQSTDKLKIQFLLSQASLSQQQCTCNKGVISQQEINLLDVA